MRFFFLISLFCSALFSRERVDFLFYLQDAGETNALLPVIERLESQGYRSTILAAGVAVELLKGQEVWTFADFGCDAVDKSWPRDRRLSDEVLERIEREIDPAAVVAGVAYEAQGQLLKRYAERPTFAYWDNFNSSGGSPYFSTARKVIAQAKTVLLPTRTIASDFDGPYEIRVVGQPTIDEWREKMSAFSEDGPAVFIGGYGKDYEEAFQLFLECAACSGQPFAVQLHPKSDGSFERAEIAKRIGIDIAVLAKETSTFEAVGRAPIVVCHQSTVGFQAMSCGKPVVYVMPEGQHFESIAIDKGFAVLIRGSEEFAHALKNSKRFSFETFDELMGIPSKSASYIAEVLSEAIPFHCGTK